jgi:DtxR family Mn-dependent transcriptional regulator
MSPDHRHDADLADQDIESIAEELWTLGEQGTDRIAHLRRSTRISAIDEILELFQRRGLARVEAGERIVLTPEGRALAERQVRRHRLAECLFTTVLDVADEQAIDRTACVMEHVVDAAITDSICAFLGHPKFCPHGKTIPSGSCCRTVTQNVEPLVAPLDRLPLGQEGRIVYIAPREQSRLVRLAHLGVVPGATVRLQQNSPAAVLRLGETTIAVDPEIAGEIYVKRVG